MPPIKNTWGQNDPEGTIRVITTPSGSQCSAERVGMTGLVRAGVLTEGDTLTDLVDKKHVRRVRGGKTADHEQIDVMSLARDPEALGRVVMLVDRVMPFVVKDPVVRLHFVEFTERAPDGAMTRRLTDEERATEIEISGSCIWTDQIPLEDKMFIFNWAVGGSADAERFLSQSEGAVADVADGKGVSRPPKRTTRAK